MEVTLLSAMVRVKSAEIKQCRRWITIENERNGGIKWNTIKQGAVRASNPEWVRSRRDEVRANLFLSIFAQKDLHVQLCDSFSDRRLIYLKLGKYD